MNTDAIGGRKFIGFLLGMMGWVAVLYAAVTKGLLNADNIQMFLFFLVLILGMFFGGNLIENFVNKRLGNGNGIAKEILDAKPQ